MHVTAGQRIQIIAGLTVRPELKQLFTGGLELGPFDEYFNEPSCFYAQGWPERPGDWHTCSERKLLPLWQHEAKIYAFDMAMVPCQCISWYIECPEEFEITSSLDSAVFDMIELHVWEYGGDEQEVEEAMQFARTVNFPNIDRLRTLLSQHVGEFPETMIEDFRRGL